MSGTRDILAGYQSLQAGQAALDTNLHQHPELSHAEHRTAQQVAQNTVDDGLFKRIPVPSVALAEHRLPASPGPWPPA